MPAHPRARALARIVAQASGPAVALLGIVVMAGWLLDIRPLQSVLPGFATMKFNTALAFVGLGVALALRVASRGRLWATVAAASAIALSGAASMEYLLDVDLGLNTIAVDDPDSAFTPTPGRMSPVTAANFILAGATMLLSPNLRWGSWRVREVVAGIVLAASLTAVGGFLFGTQAFFGASRFTTGMAVHTAGGFLVWAVGALMLDLEGGPAAILVEDSATGVVARRLVPLAIAMPMLVGLLSAVGLRRGWFDAPFALAGQIILVTVLFQAMLVITLRYSRGFETGQALSEAARRDSERRRLNAESAFKSEFLNRAAHELSTPLTPIVMRMKILEQMAERSDDLVERDSVATIQRNIARLRGIILDLVTASRMDSHVASVHALPVRADTAVKEALGRIRAAAEDKQIRLHMRGPAVAVLADRGALADVLDRILGNAVKFTPKGGRVAVRIEPGDRVRIVVQDTGRGIAPEQRDRLFQRFEQAHDPMDVPDAGTGLGLYISRLLTEAQGGRIGVESAGLGEGATFWIELPAARTPPGSSPTPAGARPGP